MVGCIRALSLVYTFSLWFLKHSQEIRPGFPWILLHADNFVILTKSVEKLCQKLTAWKFNLESKGLRANIKKTKVMFIGVNMDTLIDSGLWNCWCMVLRSCGQTWEIIQFIAHNATIGCIKSVVEFAAD